MRHKLYRVNHENGEVRFVIIKTRRNRRTGKIQVNWRASGFYDECDAGQTLDKNLKSMRREVRGVKTIMI